MLSLSFFLSVALLLSARTVSEHTYSQSHVIPFSLSLTFSLIFYLSYSPSLLFTPHPRASTFALDLSLHTNDHAHTLTCFSFLSLFLSLF